MERPIRVAHVIGMAVNGGTESLWMNYYRHIDRTKVQFDFLVESESKIIDKEEIEKMGGHVILIPSYKNPFKYKSALYKIFKENNYDIVHSNMNTLSFLALGAAKKAGIKVRIAHSHSTTNKKERLKNIVKHFLKLFSKKNATHFFACSEFAGKWLFGERTFDSGKITIINNAIDFDRFKFNEEKRDQVREELRCGDKFVIGHVGRFMPQKNHSFLIDVFNEFLKTNHQSILLLVGDGPLLPRIREKTIKLGIENKVLFLKARHDVEAIYNAMDCFVFPSLYEGLGITLIEAQVNQLPCICSTEVPDEAKISEGISFISLSKRENVWANNIGMAARFFELNKESSKRFNIEFESERLIRIYQQIVTHEKDSNINLAS